MTIQWTFSVVFDALKLKGGTVDDEIEGVILDNEDVLYNVKLWGNNREISNGSIEFCWVIDNFGFLGANELVEMIELQR